MIARVIVLPKRQDEPRYRCKWCEKTCKSTTSLKRHQAQSMYCRHKAETTRWEEQGFLCNVYARGHNYRTHQRFRYDPLKLTRVKALGVEWFDHPLSDDHYFIPLWFDMLWRAWPQRENTPHKVRDKYMPKRVKKRRKARVEAELMESVPVGLFDEIVREALADSAKMGQLKLRLASKQLDAYLTSPQQTAG